MDEAPPADEDANDDTLATDDMEEAQIHDPAAHTPGLPEMEQLHDTPGGA